MCASAFLASGFETSGLEPTTTLCIVDIYCCPNQSFGSLLQSLYLVFSPWAVSRTYASLSVDSRSGNLIQTTLISGDVLIEISLMKPSTGQLFLKDLPIYLQSRRDLN